METGSSFARWLRQQRRLLDLTQQQLADQVGCSVVTIRKFEAGERRPSKELAELLAGVLQVPTDQRTAFIAFARSDAAQSEPGFAPAHLSESIAQVATPARPAGGGSGWAGASGTLRGLPQQTLPFVGRSRELREFADQLANPECHLLSLVGPGGIGKTCLAIEVAATQAEYFEHGVCFVPLVGLSAPEQLVTAIANAIGFSFSREVDAHQQLLRLLRRRTMLLVLDNFEHLLPAVSDPGPALQLVSDIMAQAPHIRLLVTSRERLMLHGEWVYELRGMRYPQSAAEIPPDAGTEWLSNYSAVQLFMACARRVRADFALDASALEHVLRICRAVEGMPLGIELVTTWLHALTPGDIADEIEKSLDLLSSQQRDLPQRHRSLRTVFEYSWRRLPAAEQQVLQRLAVFRGGFDRHAAHELAGATLDQLALLVSKSLLKHTDGRYHIHELLRQFCLEKLRDAAGEQAAMHLHHCRYFCELLATQQQRLEGMGEAEALRRIETEIDNIRVAWRYAVEHQQYALVEQCLGSLGRFYEIRGWYEEGLQSFGQAAEMLAGATSDAEQLLLARVRIHQSVMEQYCNRLPQASRLLKMSLATAGRLGSQRDIADALTQQAYTNLFAGNLKQASSCLEEALELYETLDNDYGRVNCLQGLTWAAIETHDFERFDLYNQRTLQLVRRRGPPSWRAWALIDTATKTRIQGAYQEAHSYAQEARKDCQAIDYPFALLSCLIELGQIAQAMGDYQQAQRCYQEGMILRARIDDITGFAWCLAMLAITAAELNEQTSAEGYLQELEGYLQELRGVHEVYEVDHVLQGYYHYACGQVALSRNSLHAARTHFDRSSRLLNTTHQRKLVPLAVLGLGWTLYALGNDQQARQSFRKALRHGLQGSWRSVVLEAALGLALLLARQGATAWAAEVLIAVHHEPASLDKTRQRAARALEELRAHLPAGQPHAEPEARTDLQQLAASLLS